MAIITIASETTELPWAQTTPPRLRIYARVAFMDALGHPVIAGSPAYGNARIDLACTLASAKVVLPAVTIPATTDSIDKPNEAEYEAWLYSRGTDGTEQWTPLSTFASGFKLDHTDTSTTWEDVRVFTDGGLPVVTIGDRTISGDLHVEGGLQVDGPITSDDTLQITDDLDVSGVVTAGGFVGPGGGITGILGSGTGGGTSSTGSLSHVADSDNTDAGEIITDLFGSGGSQTESRRISRVLETMSVPSMLAKYATGSLPSGAEGWSAWDSTKKRPVFHDGTDYFHVSRSPSYDIRDYGADPTGVADSAPALRAAIAALEALDEGGEILVPFGTYLLSSASGGALATITKNMHFRGQEGVRFMVAGSVGNSTDVFLIKPGANYMMDALKISGINVRPLTGTPARHAFHFDVTNSGATLRNLLWDHNVVMYSPDLPDATQFSGRSIAVTTDIAVAYFCCSTFSNFKLYGAPLFGSGTGDSIVFRDGTISSQHPDEAMEVTQAAGAGGFLMDDVNFTSGGGLVFHSSINPVIQNCYFELANTTLTTGATNQMIYFQGNVARIDHPVVRNNLFVSPGGAFAATNAIKVGAVDGGYADGNIWNLGAGKFFTEVTADSVGWVNGINKVLVGGNGALVTGSANDPDFTDLAVSLRNKPLDPYTPTITAGTGTFTSVSGVGGYRGTASNVLFLHIVITITTRGTADGFIRATLPFASADNGRKQHIAGQNLTTGKMMTGSINPNTSEILIQLYDGTYSGASGEVIVIQGDYNTKP